MQSCAFVVSTLAAVSSSWPCFQRQCIYSLQRRIYRLRTISLLGLLEPKYGRNTSSLQHLVSHWLSVCLFFTLTGKEATSVPKRQVSTTPSLLWVFSSSASSCGVLQPVFFKVQRIIAETRISGDGLAWTTSGDSCSRTRLIMRWFADFK